MKKIGLIGGLGPESTVDYYKEIISAFNSQYSEYAYPEIIVYSANLNTLMGFVEAKQWDGLADWLLGMVESLSRAGADFAAIASNTPHIVFETVQAQSPLPLLSIVEATCAHARNLGLKTLGLLGTKLTMESDFYHRPFAARKMALVVPTDEEQRYIQDKLFSEIELGIFKESTREGLLAIAGRMKTDHNIGGLILGCTELPLILTEGRFGIPFLNTTSIHCERIIARCLER